MVRKLKMSKEQKLSSDRPAQTRSNISLLALPPELRLICYVLVGPHDFLNLICVNKQVYCEAYFLLYKCCPFKVIWSHLRCRANVKLRSEDGLHAIQRLPADFNNSPQKPHRTLQYDRILRDITRLPAEAQNLRQIELHALYITQFVRQDAIAGFGKVIKSLESRKFSLTNLTIYLYLPEPLARFPRVFLSNHQRWLFQDILNQMNAAFALGGDAGKRTTLVLCYQDRGAQELFQGGDVTRYILTSAINTGKPLDNVRFLFPRGVEAQLPSHVDQMLALPAIVNSKWWLNELFRIPKLRGVTFETYDAEEPDSLSTQKNLAPTSIGGLQAYVDQRLAKAAGKVVEA